MYEEDCKVEPREMPHKRIIKDYTPGEVIIVKPADPEKLAALREHKQKIRERRMKAGLDPDSKKQFNNRM